MLPPDVELRHPERETGLGRLAISFIPREPRAPSVPGGSPPLVEELLHAGSRSVEAG